jgi:putative endonuclease
MRKYYVYILSNRHRTVLYIGVTNNLERRVIEHKSKVNKGFSNTYNCDQLVYFEEYQHITVAIAREKRLKKYPRRWKESLINEFNPDWLDLSSGWS